MALSTSTVASVSGLPPSRAIWRPKLALALHQHGQLVEDSHPLMGFQPGTPVGEELHRGRDLVFERRRAELLLSVRWRRVQTRLSRC